MRGVGKKILIDAREFFQGRFTGIGRVLEGLTDALVAGEAAGDVVLAAHSSKSVPPLLKTRKEIEIKRIPYSFFLSEKELSDLTKKDFSLFISPYPKLPIFGSFCPSIHIIHDVLDLTHSAYRKRLKAIFDGYRLKRALKNADLTWYDSAWSLRETERHAGFVGKNPKVRHPGIDERFSMENSNNQNGVIRKYGLQPGYILVIGNGLPHKNLGILLSIEKQVPRKIVFAGVREKNQQYWILQYPETNSTWIEYVEEDDLPTLIRKSFCLAQPSTAEGYGYPPLEAMACGTPAVISKISVLIETTGGNALIVDPYDAKKWVEAFKALENKDLYRDYVKKGLHYVDHLKGRKGWQKHVSDIEEILFSQ